MKKFLLFCTCACTLLGSLASCNNDDQGNHTGNADNIPQAVLQEFNTLYPDASNVSWTVRNDHAVANFYLTADTRSVNNATNHTAWFEWSGKWGMTEIETRFDNLPQAVKEAFQASQYAGWQVDREVDILRRNNDNETLYVIEVSQGETEVDLYYTADGILVNEIIDAEADKDYHEFLPQQPAGSITTWLDERYPGHRIVDIDREDGGTEVEIITADGMKCEVLFGSNQQWMYTKTEYNRRHLAQVPESILAFLRATENYPGDNAIDDIEKYELSDGSTFYNFELEDRFDNDYNIYINETGVIERPTLPGISTGGGSGIHVDDAIRQLIDERYPGAIVVEKDYDDGYLEVDIRHDNQEKELLFNGRHEWIRSEWEVRQLPDAVMNAVTQGGYTLDDRDFDYVETATNSWYEVEVRQGWQEMKLYIAPDGNIFRTEYDD